YNFAADSLKFSEINLDFRTQAGSWLNIGGATSFNLYKYVDNIGRVNQFLWKTDHKIAQLTSFSINLSTSLQGGQTDALNKDSLKTVSNSNEYVGVYGEEP